MIQNDYMNMYVIMIEPDWHISISMYMSYSPPGSGVVQRSARGDGSRCGDLELFFWRDRHRKTIGKP